MDISQPQPVTAVVVTTEALPALGTGYDGTFFCWSGHVSNTVDTKL